MRRHNIVDGAADKPVSFERLKGLGQHPVTDPAHGPAQFGKAQRTGLQGDQHKNAPAACHVLQDLARGAKRSQKVAFQPPRLDRFTQAWHVASQKSN